MRLQNFVIIIIALLTLSCQQFFPNNSSENSDLISELESLHLDKYLGIQPKSHNPNPVDPEWEIYQYDTSDCRCILGTKFYIAARGGSVPSVVFRMAGGGACWPGQDACTKDVNPHRNLSTGLASKSAENPVGDWNFIFIPYCDGSVHIGDNNADYDGDGNTDHWHWGLKTTSAAVTLMKTVFPNPDKILVTGCSAGGYGTIIAIAVIRMQFPDAKIYVFNESGPGLLNPDDLATRDLILETWNLVPYLPQECRLCKSQLIWFYDWMLHRDSNLKIGLFSSYQDEVIGESYLGMSPEKFESLLVTTSESIHLRHPDTFKRFFINGAEHCVSNYYYDVNGISIIDWVNYLVNDHENWTELLE